MEPSLRVSLKGLKRTRDAREFYTSSAPYDEGKSLRLVVIGIARVSKARERDTLCLVLDWLFLTLSRWRVVPLYTRVDALWLTESRPAYKQCTAQ